MGCPPVAQPATAKRACHDVPLHGGQRGNLRSEPSARTPVLGGASRPVHLSVWASTGTSESPARSIDGSPTRRPSARPSRPGAPRDRRCPCGRLEINGSPKEISPGSGVDPADHAGAVAIIPVTGQQCPSYETQPRSDQMIRVGSRLGEEQCVTLLTEVLQNFLVTPLDDVDVQFRATVSVAPSCVPVRLISLNESN